MAERVQLLYSETLVDLPEEAQLSPNTGMEFASSVVRVDGGGASGGFSLVLDVLTQDGKLIASSATRRRFAPGDTGVVSYFPF